MKIPAKKLRLNAILPVRKHSTDAGMDAFASCFKFPSMIREKEEFIYVAEAAVSFNIRNARPLGDDLSHVLNQSMDRYDLHSLDRVGVGLGIATAIPEGYYASCVPRSGLSSWAGITIINSPTTIDAGYRNEWIAVVVNLSRDPHTIKIGDRICQLMLHKIEEFEWEEVGELPPPSDRGMGGFGSTGR